MKRKSARRSHKLVTVAIALTPVLVLVQLLACAPRHDISYQDYREIRARDLPTRVQDELESTQKMKHQRAQPKGASDIVFIDQEQCAHHVG